MTEIRYYRLSDVTRAIQKTLSPKMGTAFWVKAEISGYSGRREHKYFDLIETADESKEIISKIRCTLWASDFQRIQSDFKKHDVALDIKDGIVLGLKCYIQYSPVYGLSLKIVDADVQFVIGEMELRKRQLIEKLIKEGADKKNKEILVPMLPKRVGLITSDQSAVYNDIVATLRSSGYGLQVFVAHSTMQGDATKESLLRALRTLEAGDLDLVIIARGGGSKTELSHLDNEEIARRIVASRHPVWTAIGHEIDTGVLDLVANQSFKTPTALAEAIVGRFKGEEQKIQEAERLFQREWGHRWKREDDVVADAIVGIRQGTRKLLQTRTESVSASMENLKRRSWIWLSEKRSNLRRLMQAVQTKSESKLRLSDRRIVSDSTRLRSFSNEIIRKHSASAKIYETRLQPEKATKILGRATEVLVRNRSDLNDSAERRLLALGDGLRAQILKIRTCQAVAGLRPKIQMNEQREKTLSAHDPRMALKRGYSIVYDAQNRIVKTVGALGIGDEVEIELADGKATSTVNTIEVGNG